MRDVCVALLSDFGTRDVYAGVLKGIVARIAPAARLVDLTHEIPRGDVRQAAFRLWQALPHMPQGTVFLAVVDPGVGTARRPLAVASGGFSFVGPDNGIFTYLLAGRKDARAVQIARLDTLVRSRRVPAARRWALNASDTFHGRDIFAPAAGLLASGVRLERLGPEASDPVMIPWPRLVVSEAKGSVKGEALLADRFGNIITSIGRLARARNSVRLEPWVPAGCSPLDLPSDSLMVRLQNGIELPLGRTFGAVLPGSPLAYIGSDNLLEIAVNQGNASESLGLSVGSEIGLSWQ
jgi:S-adenosyl-L-methionine hydrolase (adenosine-forming)